MNVFHPCATVKRTVRLEEGKVETESTRIWKDAAMVSSKYVKHCILLWGTSFSLAIILLSLYHDTNVAIPRQLAAMPSVSSKLAWYSKVFVAI